MKNNYEEATHKIVFVKNNIRHEILTNEKNLQWLKNLMEKLKTQNQITEFYTIIL